MQILGPSPLTTTTTLKWVLQQGQAPNVVTDVSNETDVTVLVEVGTRPHLQPPTSTVRYALDGSETQITVTAQSAPGGTSSVNAMVYTLQDLTPDVIARGANAANILPITTADIQDGAVTTAKVADTAIVAAKTALAAIDSTTGGVAANAVTSAAIAPGAVGTTDIANSAVTTALIATGAVITTSIADLAIATAKLQDAAATSVKLADGSVSTVKIQNAAITNVLLGTAAVGSANIQNAAITTALIANAAITTALIANAAITTTLIANAAITNAKINDLAVDKLTAGTMSVTVTVSGIIQTAASGARIALGGGITSGSAYMYLYSGGTGETFPAFIQTGNSLWIGPANFGLGNPQIRMYSSFSGQTQQIEHTAPFHVFIVGATVVGQIDSGGLTVGSGNIKASGGIIVGPVGTGTTAAVPLGSSGFTTTSWANFLPTGVSAISVTKVRTSSAFKVSIHASAFATAVSDVVEFGVNINGTNYTVCHFLFNTAADHRTVSGEVRIAASLAAGTYTATPIWQLASGTRIDVDTNDVFTMSIQEIS